MKYIVAVSGGVDSVVLLDMLVKAGEHELIVAHFDHGIRLESDRDAAFVGLLAEKYGIAFKTQRVELGSDASEELARTQRYEFLRAVAADEQATIVTAHHLDDVIESIAINVSRGTGWRGLAVLGDNTIHRPLVNYRKQALYEYALSNELEWVEDETNLTDTYLRNRLRRRLAALSQDSRDRLIELWRTQTEVALHIDTESSRLNTSSRYFLTMIDEASALELLRVKLAKMLLSLTRPQRRRLLFAIKTARAGTSLEAGARTRVDFTVREFIVKHP